MNKLDKKQMPQFAALCVLSAGVFGYFVVKIVTPSPAAAGTRPRPAAEVLQASAASPGPAKPAAAGKAGAAPAQDAAGDADEAPAPTPGMRDPFVVGYVDPATVPAPAAPAPKTAPAAAPAKAAPPQTASIRQLAPASVGTPDVPFGLEGFPAPGAAAPLPAAPPPAVLKAAAPAAPPAPAWTVTGVLQSAAGQMAVLRNGDSRRIVRTGDGVDGLYRVVAVTRSAVVLRHGAALYHLTLGAAKSAPAAPAPSALPAPPAAPAPTPVAAPVKDAQVPTGTPVALEAGLARMVQGALLMARSYMTPAEGRMDTCFAAPPAPPQETALAPLEQDPLDLSRDVYGDGQAAGSGAQWRCVTASDLSAGAAAGETPARFI